MTDAIEKKDLKIIDFLNKNEFTISAEVIPPRNGAEQERILKQIDALTKSGTQFMSVTKGAGGSLRGGSLPIVHAIKEKFGVPAIAHFTCRDLTPQEVENQLVDHHYFGIRNILALRGDPPMDQPNWTPNEGSYHYAYQLIEQIINLNRGNYLKRPGGQNPVELEAMDFCIGSAVYPEHPDENERIEFFKKKVLAGAEYGISQMLFDTDAYARFLDLCQKHKIHVPILPGTRVLKSRQQGERMAKRFEVGLPPELANSLPDEEAAKKDPEGAMEQSIEAFVKITERFKKLGAPGLHLFVLTDTVISCRLLKELSNG